MIVHLLLVADSQDAALRVELAVHLTDGDTRMFYFQRTGGGVLQREMFEQRLNTAADIAQDIAPAPVPVPRHARSHNV